MDRKNINRGFKKLRVWQDAIALYVMACKIFINYSIYNSIRKVLLKNSEFNKLYKFHECN
jgi:hypothetical protein